METIFLRILPTMQKVSEQKNLRAESEPPFEENHPENLRFSTPVCFD